MSGPACRGKPPEWWFPDDTNDPAAYTVARTICDGCPVRAECLAGAVERREVWGMWGGLMPVERTRRSMLARRAS